VYDLARQWRSSFIVFHRLSPRAAKVSLPIEDAGETVMSPPQGKEDLAHARSCRGAAVSGLVKKPTRWAQAEPGGERRSRRAGYLAATWEHPQRPGITSKEKDHEGAEKLDDGRPGVGDGELCVGATAEADYVGDGNGVVVLGLTQDGARVGGTVLVTNSRFNRVSNIADAVVSGDTVLTSAKDPAKDVEGTFTVSGDRMTGPFKTDVCQEDRCYAGIVDGHPQHVAVAHFGPDR
jgi:hypothetical protein